MPSVGFGPINSMSRSEEDIDTDDAAQVAEVRLIPAEMNKTKAQMDVLLERERRATA
jgi:hypothetical protein